MKLRNKKTGETIDLDIANIKAQFGGISVIPEPVVLGSPEYTYNSLAELCEEWEDYEEPKEYWHIFGTNITKTQKTLDKLYDERNKEIGNYFETKEEAEKAVDKLKAWQRLKEKGFRFKGISGYDEIHFWFPSPDDMFENSDTRKDLDLLFGGKE